MVVKNLIKGNVGEWSEIYVFFRTLAEGKLYAADSDLKRKNKIFYPVLEIIRNDEGTNIRYSVGSQIILLNDGDEELMRVPINNFQNNADTLLKHLKDETHKHSFALLDIEDFMKQVLCTKLKSPSGNKRDITIKVHDMKTGTDPELGFSIKSHLGGAPTLFNANKSTNFIYKIEGNLSDSDIKKINAISGSGKIQKRLKELVEINKCKLKFERIQLERFEDNLILIDSQLPKIVSEMLKLYYSGNGSNINDLLSQINELNPCKYRMENGHPFYEYKLKNMLVDMALGMTSAQKWTGKFDATGGYIVVKTDGDVVCYHIYNFNDFQEYLLKNTHFETASSKRHEFGIITKEIDGLYFKLNLQIRFKQ